MLSVIITSQNGMAYGPAETLGVVAEKPLSDISRLTYFCCKKALVLPTKSGHHC